MKFLTIKDALRLIIPALVLGCISTAGATEKTVLVGSEIHLPANPLSISKAVETIEEQTGYRFVFDAAVFDTSREVTLSSTVARLETVLRELQIQTGSRMTVRRNYILVNASPVVTSPRKAEPPKRTGDSYTANRIEERDLRPNPRPEAQPMTGTFPLPSAPALHDNFSTPATYYSAYTISDFYTPVNRYLPSMALKVNLLYGAATLTPNLSFEIGLAKNHTLDFSGSYNPWKRIGTLDYNDKFVHWIARVGYRYWFCERFDGHFLGAHVFYSDYNISGYKVPTLFDKRYRYDGNAYGAGIDYGYHLVLGRRLGMEFNVGVGVARLDYDRYECRLCSGRTDSKSKTWFGPTRLGVSFVFMIK